MSEIAIQSDGLVGLRRGWWDLACQAVPASVKKDILVRRLRFLLRTLQHPLLSRAWYRALARRPLREVAEADYTLYRRLQQPYLCADWSPGQVLAIMTQHYEWAATMLSRRVFEGIYVNNDLALATWTSKRTYRLHLRHVGKSRRFRQEGELVAELECLDEPGEIASLSFTVASDAEGRRCLYIGGLQGALKELGPEAIKQAMRELQDLRPKSLMFFVTQTLARAWNCERILAVGLGNHAYRDHKRRRRAVDPSMKFDYDGMWLECGGVLGGDGFYTLPLETPRRTREEMKPNRRPMYARRYAMLDEIQTQIAGCLKSEG
jgi:uncharacterized protein VirK/YbjX